MTSASCFVIAPLSQTNNWKDEKSLYLYKEIGRWQWRLLHCIWGNMESQLDWVYCDMYVCKVVEVAAYLGKASVNITQKFIILRVHIGWLWVYDQIRCGCIQVIAGSGVKLFDCQVIIVIIKWYTWICLNLSLYLCLLTGYISK